MTKNHKIEKFDINEFFEIKRSIEECDTFYSTLFGLSNIEYSGDIDTACVSFDSNGNILNMLINPDYWKNLNKEEKKFLVLHELCHIIYEHPKRAKKLGLDIQITNYASDIFINHFLNNNGYIHRDLFDWKKYCWVETIFTNEKNIQIENNKNFEYYYNLLIKDKNLNQKELLGNHSNLPKAEKNQKQKNNNDFSDESESDFSSTIKDIISQNPELAKEIQKSEKFNKKNKDQLIGEIPQSVLNRNTHSDYKDFKKMEEKPQIEKILDILIPKKPQKKFKTKETWVGQGRRYVSFLKNNPNIKLPNYYEQEINTPKTKKEVWVFIDCSGSCADMFDKFTNIVMELLKNKDISCRGFSFGDDCKELNTKNLKISFSQGNDGGLDIIEETILDKMQKEKIKYPDNIVVLTDGELCFHNKSKVLEPKNWILLIETPLYYETLNRDYNSKVYSILPNGAQHFIIEDNFFSKNNNRKLKR